MNGRYSTATRRCELWLRGKKDQYFSFRTYSIITPVITDEILSAIDLEILLLFYPLDVGGRLTSTRISSFPDKPQSELVTSRLILYITQTWNDLTRMDTNSATGLLNRRAKNAIAPQPVVKDENNSDIIAQNEEDDPSICKPRPRLPHPNVHMRNMASLISKIRAWEASLWGANKD